MYATLLDCCLGELTDELTGSGIVNIQYLAMPNGKLKHEAGHSVRPLERLVRLDDLPSHHFPNRLHEGFLVHHFPSRLHEGLLFHHFHSELRNL